MESGDVYHYSNKEIRYSYIWGIRNWGNGLPLDKSNSECRYYSKSHNIGNKIKKYNRPFLFGHWKRCEAYLSRKWIVIQKVSNMKGSHYWCKGIDFNLVSIGNPDDKVHKCIFEKAIRMAEEDLKDKLTYSILLLLSIYIPQFKNTKEQLGFSLAAQYQ